MDESTRRVRMGQIFNLINETFDKNLEIEYEKLINQTMFNFGSSRRTSIEYINAALSQIESVIVKEKGVKWIIPLREEETALTEA